MWEETQHRELFTGVCIMLIISRLNGKSSHLQSIMFHVLQLMNTIDPMNVSSIYSLYVIYLILTYFYIFHRSMAMWSIC